MAIGQFISSGTGYEFKVITDASGNELDLSSALTGTDVPSTIVITTTYFDAQFRISGNNVATYTGATEVAMDGTLTGATRIEEVEARTVTTYSGDTVQSSVETGFIIDSSNVKVKEWTYNFDENGEITSGTETEGSLVRTLTADWAVVSEKGSVTGLTAINTSGIPTGAIASTGDVFKTTEGVETTYYDADGDITGYGVKSGNSTTFFDADYQWVGDVFEDSRSIEVIEVRAGADGAYSEVGSITTKDGSYGRSWTYNFDGSGSFTGGSETENGITKTYNSSWQVTSSVAELDSLTALTSAEVGELSVFGFASGDSGYKSVSGGQTTYYSVGDDGGVIVGYTETHTGSDSSSTLYFDEDYAWLGETRTEGAKTRTEFVTRDTTNGTLTVAGSESDGAVTLREWKYIHNESTGDLIEGYEIQNDIRIDFGANWVVTSETFTGTTTTITDAGELALIPDTLKFDASGTTTASYSVITNPWGTETVYFNGAGAVLGRSFENTGPAGETFTGFNDDDGQYLGSIFELGTRKEVRFETRDDQTLQTTETGAEYEAGSSTPVRTWTYIFDNTFNLVSGTETEGGVTKTFGANWELTSTAVSNISALDTTTDVDLMPSSFVFEGTAYYLEKDYGNNTERTFYNPEDSSLIGYSNTFTDTLRGSVNTFFENADREWIGDYQNSADFEFAFFNIENGDGTYTEYGFESGNGFDRSWEIQKSSTGQITGGYQIENGITTVFDEFGNIASKKVAVDNLQEVTADLDDLPVSWILTKDDSSEYALRQVKSSSWGDEATYFDASGNILGVARSWSDTWGGITAQGISFEDANFNYLGDVYIENNGSQTRKYVRFESQNDTNQVTSKNLSYDRHETGYEYIDGILDRSWDFKFDLLGKLVEGTETVGGITTQFGPGWVVEGTSVSAENITTTLISAEEARFLPTAFVDVVGDGSTATYTTYTVTKNYDWGGSETIYFDTASGSPAILGYENSWSDPSWGASGSGFEDANRNWLGDVYNDGQTLRYNFFYTETVDGTDIRFEAGGEYSVTNGVVSDTAERSYSFQFDNMTGDLIQGSESYGGSTTNYGANWTIEGQSKDNFNVDDFLLTEEQEALIVFLPDEFINKSATGLVYTYAEEQRMSQSDSFITFYDENGSAIGYANIHDEMDGFWIGLNDLEWNFLGNISSFGDKVEVRQEKIEGGKIVESGSEYSYINGTVDIESPIRTWEYRFDPTTYNFLGGTETNSGVTTTYGANWVVTGKSVSASNIVDTQVSEFDASLLPTSFVINIGTSDAADYHVYTSTQNYDWGGSETIYFSSNSEGATILGYENTWTWSDFGRTETGSSFENANRVYLGDTYDNGDWVNARFEISTLTSRTEKGVEYEYNTDGTLNQVAVREWEFVFKGNNLSSGTETFDGATTVYGENWTIISSQKANFSANDLKTTVAQDPYIALLPDALKVVDIELGMEVIYSETKQTPWGDEETTYYDASGNLLGYGFGWNDQNSGAAGGSFNTADWKPLGDYYDDGVSFAQVRTQTFNETTNRITEAGVEFGYVAGELDITNPVREFSNTFDGSWNFISGTETIAGVTTTFGANRSVTSKTFDVAKIVETQITVDDAKLLPDSFVLKTGPADALVYTTYSISSASGNDTNVTYFDGNASDAVLIGTSNSWTNTWTDAGSIYHPSESESYLPSESGSLIGSPSELYPTSPSAITYNETGTEFLDADDNFIGHIFNDGSYVNANFSYFDADGSRHEKGGEYEIVSDLINFSSPIREYEYNYGPNGKLVDGVRIEDGLTTEFGSDFSVTSVIDTGFADRKLDIKQYEADDALLDAYAEIGSRLIAGTDEGGAYIYKEYDSGSADLQFKLYSETGSIIARVHENTWVDDYQQQTIKNYYLNDANYNYIGRIEDRGDTVRIENYTETATTKTWSGSTFAVNSGVLDTSAAGILEQYARIELLNGTFVSETHTEGGVITSFDKYGGVISTTFANLPDLVAKTAEDFEFLPEIFVSNDAVYAHEVPGNYGDKKIYFFDDAQGSNQIGSAEYYSHTGPTPDGGTDTYENYYFYDSLGNNIGSGNISSDYKYYSANYDLGGYEIVTESGSDDWGSWERYEQFYNSGPNAGKLYQGYEVNGNFKTNYGFDYELINTEFYGTFDPDALGLLELSEPTLTLDQVPTSGELRLDGIAVSVDDTVTYSELANGALKYYPGNSVTPEDTNLTATFLDADGVKTTQQTFGIPVGDPKKIDVSQTLILSGLSDGDAITVISLPDSLSGTLQLLTNYGLEEISTGDTLIIGDDTLIFTPNDAAIGVTPTFDYNYNDAGVTKTGILHLPVAYDPVELSPASVGWLNPLAYFPQSMINTEGSYDYILATKPVLNTFSNQEEFQQTIYASEDHPTLSEGSLIGEVYTRYFQSGISTGMSVYFQDSDREFLGRFETTQTREYSEYRLDDGTVVEKEIRWQDETRNVIEFEKEFLWSDNSFDTMISGYKVESGVRKIYNEDGTVVTVLEDASQAMLFDDAAVLGFMPSTFLINGGVEAYVIMLEDLQASPQTITMKFYDPISGVDPIYLGEGILTFEQPIYSMDDVGMVPMTFTAHGLDGAEFGTGKFMVLSEGENTYYKYVTAYEETIAGARTVTSSTTLMNSDEAVIDQEAYILTYDASDPDILVSTRLTKNGQTTITFEDGSEAITNSAPVITVTADTADEISAGLAGAVDVNPDTKTSNPANFWQAGVVSVSDADGDIVSLRLSGAQDTRIFNYSEMPEVTAYFGGNETTPVEVQMAQNEWGYGILLFQPETGKYIYNFSDPYSYYSADHADEYFIVSSSDDYHNVFQELNFELLNANNPSWAWLESSDPEWTSSDPLGTVAENATGQDAVVTGTFTIRNGEVYSPQDISIGYYDKIWSDSTNSYQQGSTFTKVLDVDNGVGNWSAPAILEYGSIKFKITNVSQVTNDNNWHKEYIGEFEYTYDPNQMSASEHWQFDEGNVWNDWGYLVLKDGQFENGLYANFEITGENYPPIVTLDDGTPPPAGSQISGSRFDGGVITHNVEENQDYYEIWFNVTDKPPTAGEGDRKLVLTGADKNKFVVLDGANTLVEKDGSSTANDNVYLLTDTSKLGFKLKFAETVDLDFETAADNQLNVDLAYYDEDGASVMTKLLVNITDDPDEHVPSTNTAPQTDNFTITAVIEDGLEIQFANYEQMTSAVPFTDAEDAPYPTGLNFPSKFVIKSLPPSTLGTLEYKGNPVNLTSGEYELPGYDLSVLKFVPKSGVFFGDQTQLLASFDFAVKDSNGSESGIKTATIVLENNAPSLDSAPNDVSMSEDSARYLSANDFGQAVFNDGEHVGASLTNIQDFGIQLLAAPSHGVLEYDGSEILSGDYPLDLTQSEISSLKFIPTTGESGADYATLRFKVSDGYSYSSEYSLNIDVIAGNQAPTSGDAAVSTITSQSYYFDETDFPFSDDITSTIQGVKIISATGDGVFSLNNTPYTGAFPLELNASDLSGKAFSFYSETEGTAILTFEVFDGAKFSTVHTLTVTAADNTAPTVTSQTLSNLELGSETAILDWGFSDLDHHSLGRIEFTGGDLSWLKYDGSSIWSGDQFNAGELNLLTIKTPYSGGSQQFTYIAYDEFGAASAEATFILSAVAPIAIGALDGNEATARIGGYSYLNISGNLLNLLDISNVSNGIDVSNYAGGILNITPVAMYSQTATIQLGFDVAEIPVGEWADGYLEMMLESGGTFKLYDDLDYEISVSTQGGLSAGDTQDIFLTFAKEGEDTVQGQINVEFKDPAPINDANLNQALSENLYNGQSQVVTSGQLDLQGQTSVEIYHVESDYNYVFNLSDNWRMWPYQVTGSHGSLEINQDGSYQYHHQGPAAGVSSGSVTDTFNIIVDTASDAADYNSAVPRTGTMTFTGNYVGSPVFTVVTNDAQGADLIIDAGNGDQRSIDLYIDPNDSEVLKFSKVTLNDQFVKDQIDGLASNSALDLSFKLGALPTSGSGSTFIELTVQDKGDGDMSVESGERAISMVFEVDYDSDSISLPQQSGVEVSYKGANGGIATFYVDNLDADTINLIQGTNSTPNSLNLKLGSILAKLDGSSVYSSSLLSDPGNYIVSLTGKSALDNGGDVELPIVDSFGNSIKSIVGEVEIVDPPSNVKLLYGGNSVIEKSLITTEDPFGKVTFGDFDVNAYVFTDQNLSPSLEFNLNDAIDTNGGSWAEKVAIQIYYDDNDDGNLDNGEAWVEAIFEVQRSGDGITESISTGGTGSPADDITISYGNQVGDQGPIELTTITLSNDSVDIFSIIEGERAGTPGSMNVRLNAILDEFRTLGGANVPLPQVGDDLEISISLLLENDNEQEILDGSISII